ncbi:MULTISPECIES: sigma-E factor negative regulatory protein [Alteromonas]|jgi:sigma-E factor negative regulatory protein RseA|uniref:Anti-sigma-E factor RseA n=2 Tax=Alteromonas TaxID=226 RepID=A0AAW7Z1X0_9ALTE|nr:MULTISPECIES: RseA family anti-sigma factor [Alteromonas]AMJ91302.1 transcriptional regulator [Alteromonas sp. Mac2]AEF02402.1 sigma E factor negative regulatory protein [Alteromonas naphthalenivorans]ALM89901.1 Sigma factor RpoE negative regulatory protein RseA [Alteromonas stellipolaris LMG 21856]AMJ75035.1 transcriptional regulator [Alteromonas stellipolaris]AMJ87440.1 transcriptional regulator [Alteromonas sp. Mac1]|tara:strand:- start:1354 stop:1953 length:600 start_codon:yes stop_codon:yes gene_type:complete
MTQQQENLSAFMDGEIDGDAIIDAIKQDEELQAKWQRYHVIRGAMRKEASVAPQLDITASVAAALENEPAIVAPKASRWRSIPVLGSVVSGGVVPFAKQSGQFAVAASVAVAVILGVQHFNQPAPTEPFMTAPTAGPQGGLAPVSLEQTRALPRNDMNEVLEKKRKINALIADHEQQVKLKQAQESETDDAEASADNRP